MDVAYGLHYRTLYTRHWWWRAREAAILDALKRLEPQTGWCKILDVGCGDGLFFDELLRFGDVHGVEPATWLVSPDGPHHARIFQQEFDERFQPDRKYSLILMLDVLEHLDQPARALKRAGELLERDGTVLVTVPAFNAVWTRHDVINHHRTRYTKRTFRALATEAGMEVREESYWFYWTFPVKLLERGLQQLFGWPSGHARVPASSVNQALLSLTKLERAVFERFHPPFGTSLMVVMKRLCETPEPG